MEPEITADEVVENLLRARDEVAKAGGWRQESIGAWDQPEGSVCAMGAMRRVLGEERWHQFAYVGTIAEVRAFRTATGNASVQEWNDDFDRKQSEVVEAFDRAAWLVKAGDVPL